MKNNSQESKFLSILVILIFGLAAIYVTQVRAEGMEIKKTESLRFGLLFQLGWGYYSIGNKDLEWFDEMGLGEISQGGFLPKFGLGFGLSWQQKVASYVEISYSGLLPIGYSWKDCYGSGEDVPMCLNVADLDLKFYFFGEESTLYFLVGKTLIYDLVDEYDEGFLNGGGDYHFGLGIKRGTMEKGSLAGWGIEVIYRPYKFKEFKVGESMPVEFSGDSVSIILSFELMG